MKKNKMPLVVILAYAVCLCSCGTKEEPEGLVTKEKPDRKLSEALDRPNVLFIAIDDLNTCPEGFNGETTVHTPNITRLADMGVRFTNAHCAAPACNPSRASVMTGLAPATTGVYLNSQDWRENKILKDRTTLPQHFKNNGYKTQGGGKLYHAASLSGGMYEGYLDPRPWDEYFPSKNRQMPKEVAPPRIPANGNPMFYNGHMDWAALDIDTNEMADAKVVSWAEKQLSKKHDQPLFLAVGIYRPHIPWWTPKEYFEKHPIEEIVLPEVIEDDLADVPEAGRAMRKQGWHKWTVENGKWEEAVRGYNASVSFTDDMIGRLLKALEDGPLAKNTIIVFWSDHVAIHGAQASFHLAAVCEVARSSTMSCGVTMLLPRQLPPPIGLMRDLDPRAIRWPWPGAWSPYSHAARREPRQSGTDTCLVRLRRPSCDLPW